MRVRWGGVWFGIAYWPIGPIGSSGNTRVSGAFMVGDDRGVDQPKVSL